MIKPQLYLVGAPKAGSSALSAFLGEHPQINMCRIKEPNFHCRDFDIPSPRTEQEYLGLFDRHKSESLLGDASILYLYSQQAAASIASYAESPKILIILRDPIEAMYAWHSQMVFTANEPLEDFQEALKAETARKNGRLLPSAGTGNTCPQLLYYREIFNYAEQLPRYFELFDKKQIHVVLYDDFKIDASNVYAEILNFLGLSSFSPNFKKVNPPKVRRNLKFHLLLKKLFAAPTRRFLPPELRLQIICFLDKLNSKPKKRKPLDADFELKLKSEFRPAIMELEKMIDRDLSNWYV